MKNKKRGNSLSRLVNLFQINKLIWLLRFNNNSRNKADMKKSIHFTNNGKAMMKKLVVAATVGMILFSLYSKMMSKYFEQKRYHI